MVDIQSEGKKDVTVETLQWIHEHKTAALLEFCVVGGGILGGYCTSRPNPRQNNEMDLSSRCALARGSAAQALFILFFLLFQAQSQPRAVKRLPLSLPCAFVCACVCVCRANPEQVKRLSKFAMNIGLAFQVSLCLLHPDPQFLIPKHEH